MRGQLQPQQSTCPSLLDFPNVILYRARQQNRLGAWALSQEVHWSILCLNEAPGR